MGEVDPLAVVQCHTCGWWWYLYDRRPTEPYMCFYCKHDIPVWHVEERKVTPAYGTLGYKPKKRKKV